MTPLLLSMLEQDKFNQYSGLVRSTIKSEEAREILSVLDNLHSQVEGDLSLDDLQLGLRQAFPEKKADLLVKIVESWKEVQYNPALVQEYLADAQRRAKAYEITLTGLKVFEGSKPYSELLDAVQGLEAPAVGTEFEFVPQSILALKEAKENRTTVKWRLNTLNRLIGPLSGGQLGCVFARSDSGKSTFLQSEAAFFAEQLDGPLLYLANEERASISYTRCLMAYFDVTERELMEQAGKYEALWKKRLKGRLIVSGDPLLQDRRNVDSLLNKMQPKMVFIDQISKIGGFKEDRRDLELGKAWIWARSLAKRYDIPVICVSQASAGAENKKYLRMDDVADSKTAVAAECDWILGIGRRHDEDGIRYLHTSKDKTSPSELKDEGCRGGYLQLLLKAQKARFEDLAT